MRKIIIVVLTLLVNCSLTQVAFSATLSGTVSGQWQLTDSPITINGNTTVAEGTQLTIDPGVSILFAGPYSFTVNGKLQAEGTKEQPIRFTWATQTNASRWQGIRIENSADTSTVEYCFIEHTYQKYDEGRKVRGGAIRIYNSSSIIRNNTIRYNTVVNDMLNGAGGAIYIESNNANLIENNVLSYNESDSGGAIAVIGQSRPVIRRNIISNNTANYSGGGIYVGVSANAEVNSNTLRNNISYGWGGGAISLWNNNCDASVLCTQVFNNILFKNSASSSKGYEYGNGGGIYSRYNNSIFLNNTIVANIATGGGGGFFVLNQGINPPRIINSIIRSNNASTGAQILVDGIGGQVTAESNNIEGGWTGAGNIDQFPDFVNQNLGLLRYMPGSAGIDSGDGSVAGLPTKDIVGRNRTIDGDENGSVEVDMGAFEFDPSAALPSDINGNTEITVTDTISILQLLTGRNAIVNGKIIDIDVNGDNVIGLEEVLYSLDCLKKIK